MSDLKHYVVEVTTRFHVYADSEEAIDKALDLSAIDVDDTEDHEQHIVLKHDDVPQDKLDRAESDGMPLLTIVDGALHVDGERFVSQVVGVQRIVEESSEPPAQEIIAALKAAGLKADHAFTPSEVTVILDERKELLLTRHFNVDGWEASVSVADEDPYGIEDGPAADAPAADVVAWVQREIAAGLRPA